MSLSSACQSGRSLHLGNLVGTARGNLLDTKGGQLILQVSDLLGELAALLPTQLGGLDVSRL